MSGLRRRLRRQLHGKRRRWQSVRRPRGGKIRASTSKTRCRAISCRAGTRSCRGRCRPRSLRTSAPRHFHHLPLPYSLFNSHLNGSRGCLIIHKNNKSSLNRRTSRRIRRRFCLTAGDPTFGTTSNRKRSTAVRHGTTPRHRTPPLMRRMSAVRARLNTTSGLRPAGSSRRRRRPPKRIPPRQHMARRLLMHRDYSPRRR